MIFLLNESLPDFPILEISHPALTARVALQGAHLLDWTPTGQAPVLYLSPQATFVREKAIRGGVPVCWPWFGPHPQDALLPAHGFARTQMWTLAHHRAQADEVHLQFILTDSEATRRLWPHAFQLELTMTLGARLHLQLRMKNLSDANVILSTALHTYFQTADILQTRITGLDGVPYHEVITDPPNQTQAGDVTFHSEVDRLYASGAPVQIHDPVSRRRIAISSTGSASCVVWNPWHEKSLRLTDLPDTDYQRFLCVETTNAGADTRQLAPGETHVLTQTIEITPMDLA